MTNIDDHMEEHAAEAARKAAELAKAKEAERDFDAMHYSAYEDNKRFDEIRKTNVIRERIFAILPTLTKLSLKFDKEEGRIFIGSIDTNWNLKMKEDWTSGGIMNRGSKPTGKYRISVGDYGNTTQYPQRKDGTHNYVEIARSLVHYAERKLETIRLEAQKDANKSIVADLAKELGLAGYQTILSSSMNEKFPVHVKISVSTAMTAERAKLLVETLRGLGFELKH